MKRKFAYVSIVLLFLVGLLWVFNNLLGFYFIPEKIASSLLVGAISGCLAYYAGLFFFKRK